MLFFRVFVLFFVGLGLLGCAGEEPDAPHQYSWSLGETWHVGARYKIPNLRTESVAVGLDGEVVDTVGEHWSDQVVWTYQVVESGLVPTDSDPLYPYALGRKNRVKSLSVVRAHVDPSLNPGVTEISGTAPVIYLVFREDRARLAAVLSFSDNGGSRIEKAYSSKQLDTSWSVLSQSMLTPLPTYLPPHGVKKTNGTLLLENGSTMDMSLAGGNGVDVRFSDELAGGDVNLRVDFDSPWPTWLETESMEANLLDENTILAYRTYSDTLPAPPEDQDYRAALANAVDIDVAVQLQDELIDTRTSISADEKYLPWNGSWWPQSKGALVFGYHDKGTFSDRIRETIDPVRTRMDASSAALQDLEPSDEDYESTVASYREDQQALVDALVSFYDTILKDLDGGRLTYGDGTLTHVDGWSYKLDDLSPMDKTALALYDRGETTNNPFYMAAWEILNHYSPGGGSWWGHCNGWAAAAILMDEPTEDVSVNIGNSGVQFTAADLKGLLSESHYSTYSRFYGSRYYKEGDDISDLNPAAFHKLMSFYLMEQQIPMVFDTDSGEQVWNFPAYGADLDVVETTVAQDRLVNINTATEEELDALPGIGPSRAAAIIDHREYWGPFQSTDEVVNVWGVGSRTLAGIQDLISVTSAQRTFDVTAVVAFATDGVDEEHIDDGHPGPHGFTKTWKYTLVTDPAGVVVEGTWEDEAEHPDFAWVPFDNPTFVSNDSSENPFLSYGSLLNLVGTDLERR